MLCPRDAARRAAERRPRRRASRRRSASTARRPASIEFDHAEAFLLGKRGQGFRAMLDLMNNARLGVAAQAIGIAEARLPRGARRTPAQRVQFGAPIIQQPLVKSMLTLMAINIQAARALLYRTCALIDLTRGAARTTSRRDARRGDPRARGARRRSSSATRS